MLLRMQTDRAPPPPYGQMEALTPMVRRIVARNPGPYTYWGTGTYVIGRRNVAIIDPGPALESHIEAILAALAKETVTHILVTHTHEDHSAAAAAIKAATGAPTYGFGRHATDGASGEAGIDTTFEPDFVLGDGDSIVGVGWHLASIHTPGHTSNHLCYALPEDGALFTGDHVMGWSTTVVSPPDGNMRDYMQSLLKLSGRAEATFWPTHGDPIRNPLRHVADLIEHRLARRQSVLSCLGQVPISPDQIVKKVYRSLHPELRSAAAQTVLAHLLELVDCGLADRAGEAWIRASRPH
ncbi:MAG: MBL fold metallo-hydrolase [Dongiaceae bacterium]